MAVTTPSPAEAPKNISELNDAAKQTSFIDELVKSHGLTEHEKKQFSEKYSKAIKELSDRYADKKDIVITEIGEILKTFKDSLQHEKNDDDDTTEFASTTPDIDKTDTDTEKKLGGQEIDDHIKQLSAKIEAKLNAPKTATPEEPATAPKQAIMATLRELNISADIPPLPNDYVSTNKPNWMIAAITKFLEAAGLGFLANILKMQTIGYKSERQMEYTKNAMTTLLSIKESPLSSIIRLDDITEREFREVLTTHGDIDLSVKENAEAALLGLHADNPKYKKYHRIYLGIEDMAKKMTGTDSVEYNPKTRLDDLLSYSKKEEFSPDYTPHLDVPAVAVPIPLTEAEIRAAEEKQKLTELQEAKKADKEANDSRNPDQGKAIEKVTEIKNNAAKEIKAIYDQTKKTLETASAELILEKNLLSSSPSDKKKEIESKIAQLQTKVTQIEQSLGKMKTEADFMITGIENDTYVVKDGALAEDALLRLNSVKTIYKNIEDNYREKSSALGVIEKQKTQQESLVETDIEKTKEEFQKIIDIIGTTGKKALKRDDIIKVGKMKSELYAGLAKIDSNINEYESLRGSYEIMKKGINDLLDQGGAYKFKDVGQIRTDFDESYKDYDLEKNQVNNVKFERLIAVSPDQEVAYFFVTNCGGKEGYMRLILSKKESEYTDGDGTPAAFFPIENQKAGIEEEIADIAEIETNMARDNFSTIELNNTGTWADDDLDWLDQGKCDWKQKVQGLGLIIPEETV